MDAKRNDHEPVEGVPTAAAAAAEESLVEDVRANLSPAQMVERKLVSLLKSVPLPMSRLQESPVQRLRARG